MKFEDFWIKDEVAECGSYPTTSNFCTIIPLFSFLFLSGILNTGHFGFILEKLQPPSGQSTGAQGDTRVCPLGDYEFTRPWPELESLSAFREGHWGSIISILPFLLKKSNIFTTTSSYY
jgi:hypothetical protein